MENALSRRHHDPLVVIHGLQEPGKLTDPAISPGCLFELAPGLLDRDEDRPRTLQHLLELSERLRRTKLERLVPRPVLMLQLLEHLRLARARRPLENDCAAFLQLPLEVRVILWRYERAELGARHRVYT
jgi:hypothetical protein